MLYKGIHINDDLIEKYNQQYMGEFQPDIFDVDILERTCDRAEVKDIKEGIRKYGQKEFEDMINDVLEEVSAGLEYSEIVKVRGLDIEKDLLDMIFPKEYEYTEEDPDFKRFISELICAAYYRLYGKEIDNADMIIELSKHDKDRMYILSSAANVVLRRLIEKK